MVGFWRRKPVEEEAVAHSTPMPSIFDRPAPPPLPLFTLNELIPPIWRVDGADGASHGRAVRFLPDGRVLGTVDVADAHWRLEDGRLIVGPEAGDAVWSFDERETRSRREVVRGEHHATGDELLMRREADDLQTVVLLHRPSQPLSVVFNSSSNPATSETAWELHDMLHEGSTDLVLFAEASDPSFFYLNKTGRVLDRLRLLPAAGYRELLFIGQGSGGFAALMFAELLSYEFHDCRIRSVTINPHTALGAEHDAAIRQAAAPAQLPPFVDADALAQKDCPVAGIRDLVRMSIRRRGGQVEHRVLHDGGNAAQAYHAHAVSDLAGFGLRPTTLGLPHGEGIEVIRRSDDFQAALAWGREQ